MIGVDPERSPRGRPGTGHDPQPRAGQASHQAIEVDDRVDVVNHAAQTDPQKGTLAGPGGSGITHHAADDAIPCRSQPQAGHHKTYRRFNLKNHLRRFYFDACGFRLTDAGLIRPRELETLAATNQAPSNSGSPSSSRANWSAVKYRL